MTKMRGSRLDEETEDAFTRYRDEWDMSDAAAIRVLTREALERRGYIREPPSFTERLARYSAVVALGFATLFAAASGLTGVAAYSIVAAVVGIVGIVLLATAVVIENDYLGTLGLHIHRATSRWRS